MVAFLLFAVVAAVTPGPSNIMLTAAGAHAGVRKGLPCLFGVVTGMSLMMFLVPLGLGSLVLSRPLVLKTLNFTPEEVELLLEAVQIAKYPDRARAKPALDRFDSLDGLRQKIQSVLDQ